MIHPFQLKLSRVPPPATSPETTTQRHAQGGLQSFPFLLSLSRVPPHLKPHLETSPEPPVTSPATSPETTTTLKHAQVIKLLTREHDWIRVYDPKQRPVPQTAAPLTCACSTCSTTSCASRPRPRPPAPSPPPPSRPPPSPPPRCAQLCDDTHLCTALHRILYLACLLCCMFSDISPSPSDCLLSVMNNQARMIQYGTSPHPQES